MRCPLCGTEDSIKLDLSDMNNLSCDECSETFTIDDLREIINEWMALIKKIEKLNS